MGFNSKKEYSALLSRTNKWAVSISERYSRAVNQLLALNKTYHLEEGEIFSFDDNPQVAKQVERILKELNASTYAALTRGIKLEWENGNKAADEFVASVFGKQALKRPEFAGWMKRNTDAMKAFIARADNGIKLSDRVWKTAEQLKGEMELALSVTIGEGKSAAQISREVRKYLQNPDALFRRIYTYTDAKGERHYKLSQAAKAYKSGKGVYRSAAKNAMRLARTETNMAYRTADNLRWSQMDFVTGIHIGLSKSHPIPDICDELAGDYPKDFKFTGWHPNCFCVVTPITISDDEFVKMQQAKLAGQTYDTSSEQITEYPDEFKQWVIDNKERLLNAKAEGRLPYFAKDNWKKIDELFNPITQSEGYKLGQSVLNEMSAIPDVDTKELQKALAGKDLDAIDIETKKLQAIKDELNNMPHINDAYEQAKTYGYEAIKGVETSVAKKLEQWEGYSLEYKKKKLEFEINEYLGTNKYGAQTKYKTWSVSQKAYIKELEKVKCEMEYENIISSYNKIYSPNAKELFKNSIIPTAKEAIKKGDLDQILSLKTQAADFVDLSSNYADYVIRARTLKSAHIKDLETLVGKAYGTGDINKVISATKELKQWADIAEQKAYSLEWAYSNGNLKSIKSLTDTLDEAISTGKITNANDTLAKLNALENYVTDLTDALAFKTKSKEYNELVAAFKSSIETGDIADLEKASKALQTKRAILDNKRKGKTTFITGPKFEEDGVEFGLGVKIRKTFESSAYSKKRKVVNSVWCKSEFESKEKYGEVQKKVFAKASKEELEAQHSYTAGSGYFNRPLRGYKRSWGNNVGIGNVSLNYENNNGAKHIKSLTEMIEKSTYNFDVWLQRGVDDKGLRNFLGFDLRTMTQEEIDSLIGKEVVDTAFMSCGAAKGTGFSGHIINVYCPKGTRMLYMEGHSAFNGQGENEMLIQRGTHFRITKIEKRRYDIFIDVEVIGQI